MQVEHKISKIVINPEYLELVPRPVESDYQRLYDSIKKSGQNIPITVNEKGVILDGHTRYEICKELELKIKYHVKTFENSDDEMKFVVMTNLSRRHLTPFQKIELAWSLFELEKKRAQERVLLQGGPNQKGISRRYGPKKEGLSAELFGKKIGFGKTVINKVDYLKKNASDPILEDLRTEKTSISKAYDLVRGLKLIPSGEKPEKHIKFCPKCNTETTSPMRKKCHVHTWFCCTHCGWGV